MDAHRYSSSPDPIILPSSPPSAHVRNISDARKSGRAKSPAKSFIINTPAARGKSPWRIRLTVEPQSESDNGSAMRPQKRKATHDAAQQPRTRRRTASLLGDFSDRAQSGTTSEKRKHAPTKARAQDEPLHGTPTPSKSLHRLRSPRTAASTRTRATSRLLESETAGDQTIANEDFTMISGDSLASIKANNSLLISTHRAARTHHDPNIDPNLEAHGDAVTYPDLRHFDEYDHDDGGTPQEIDHISEPQVKDYDAMSWQPTSQPQRNVQQASPQDASRSIATPGLASEGFGEDIWAEEASRSIQDEARPPIAEQEFVPPIFSDEVQPPRRAKIPKTWRKASGVNIPYSDSPAQAETQFIHDRPTVHQNDQSTAANSILSPPRTDESAQEDQNSRRRQFLSEALDGSELTNPDAAATQLQSHEQELRPDSHPVQTPQFTARGAVTPSADETGLFWRTDRQTLFSKGPLRPKPRRDDLPDLSDILNIETPRVSNTSRPSLVKADVARTRDTSQPQSQIQSRLGLPDISRVQKGQADPEASQVATNRGQFSELQSNKSKQQPQVDALDQHRRPDAKALQLKEASKADTLSKPLPSSQGLQSGHTAKTKSYGRKYFGKHQTKHTATGDSFEDSNEPSQSYEEHLNRLSPGKHKVDFNDSTLPSDSNNRLKPSKVYPALFNAKIAEPVQEATASDVEEELALDQARGTSAPLSPETQPGLLNRWASALWSTLIRPRGPIYHNPAAEVLDDPIEDMPSFPPSLRARLRARYGVLQIQHPWTMMHMRTLHRMVKSVSSRGKESMIPTTLRLPQFLDKLIGSYVLSATGEYFNLSFEHACAVWSFMQILVPISLVRAMERGEVEWLGDDIIASYRGRIAGRWGNELCFKTVLTPEGAIEWQWLVSCVGCILVAEEMATLNGDGAEA